MRRALLIWSALVASVSLGLLLGIVLATPASANTYGTLGDHDLHADWLELRDEGYLGTEAEAEHMAIDVCVDRAYFSAYELIAAAARYRFYTSNQLSGSTGTELAGTTVVGAEYHLCTVYYGNPAPGIKP
jgi:hypothetical protein